MPESSSMWLSMCGLQGSSFWSPVNSWLFNQSPTALNHASALGNGKPFYKHLGRKHRQGHFWWTAVVKHSSRWTAASGTWCASTPGRQNRDSSQKKWSSEARTWALVQKALKILSVKIDSSMTHSTAGTDLDEGLYDLPCNLQMLEVDTVIATRLTWLRLSH